MTAERADDLSGLSSADAPYDEAYDDGQLRPLWTELVSDLGERGPAGLAKICTRARRLVDNDGITYNEVGHTRQGEPVPPKPWRLDPLPLLISPADWDRLESGLVQRATLLDELLTDIYGPMRLVRDGLLAPELIFGHPGYVRAAHGIFVPSRRQLFLHGCDVSRWPDGAFRVSADWTQAPSGVGYALAGRRVVARAIPEVFEHASPRPVTTFAQAMRLALIETAADTVENPLVVVLSPGTHSETAFDQAYVASVLGFPLVESADLVVRDGELWMRSLGTLKRVDVVLRRVDADFSDPLDLRPDSRLGVVGLVEVLRRGGVTAVNTLGSGVLENPSLAAFLPKLSRALLGEELQLESVPTFWAGDELQRKHVQADIGNLVLRSATETIDGRLLHAAQREALRARIGVEQWRWVGQEPAHYSVAPSLLDDAVISSKPVGLRTFSLARRLGFAPLVGGLGRVMAGSADARSVAAKDVWVRTAARAERVTVRAELPEKLPEFHAPGTDVVTSPRVLADLFWMGRYSERAEDTARLLIATRERYQEYRYRPWLPGSASVPVLMAALLHLVGGTPADEPVDELRALTADVHRSGSLAHSVDRFGNAARAVRDQLSHDTWMVLGGMERAVADYAADPDPDESGMAAAHSAVLGGVLALSGLGAESMVHDTGWHVMDIGKRIERALCMAALLSATLIENFPAATERVVVEAVLAACESAVTYRRRNRGALRIASVAQLLLFDAGNPRSLVFQLDALRVNLLALPGASGSSRPERLVEEVAAQLRRVDPSDLEIVDKHGRRAELAELLESVHTTLRTVSDLFAAAKLSLPAEIQPLWGPTQERVFP